MERDTLGALLKRYRTEAGLTQEMLAEQANLSTRAISDLERGLSRAPHYDTLNMLAGAMSLSTEQRAALFGAARPMSNIEPAQQTPAGFLQSLPSPPTALIGREKELAYGLRLLRDDRVRLLTLTGPGGVGKTRLGLHIAHEIRSDFPDSVVYVDLTPISDAVLVPQVTAQALGLREESVLSFYEQILALLGERPFLILFDNFEQVLDAAEFVANLLVKCPGLQVVVTSRAPLRLRAEHQLLLAPLALHDAPTLFYARAQAQGVHFLPEDTLLLVTAICEQVDRIPLAIELAVAHVRMLSLPVLLERLGDRLSVLRGGARDLPERQQNMRSAIAWSYNLLQSAEQRSLRALSHFVGGFTLEAASAMCSDEETGSATGALASVAALVDAALVQSETTGLSTPRYSMLEVIREYALEQSRTLEEDEQHARHHAYYYAQLAEEVGWVDHVGITGEMQLSRESSNGRAALLWAHERDEVELGLRLATWFGQYWFRHGQVREAGLWLERMIDLDPAGEKSVAPSVRGRALYSAARYAMSAGRLERAAAMAQEAEALAKQTGDQADISKALAMLGSLALTTGREDEAVAYFTESHTAAQLAGEARAQALALLNLSEIARKRGELNSATRLLEDSLAIVSATGMTWSMADTFVLLGHLARQQGDHGRAAARYREGLELYKTLGDTSHTAWCLEGIAALDNALQDYKRVARVCAAAAALRASTQIPPPQAEQEEFDKIVMTARARLGASKFAKEWAAGSAMSHDEAILYALNGLSG